MDTEKAKVYLTALELGSFSAAARQLGYTTSGISRSVASLEEETGIRLFIRGRKGVVPTGDAEELIPILRELVHLSRICEEKEGALHDLECGTVTIGISYAAYFRVISEKMREFRDAHPQVTLRTIQGTSSELLGALERRECDFALMTRREGPYRFHELRKDPMVACVPEGHPSEQKGVFSLKQFADEPMIAAYSDRETDYRRALEAAGIIPDIRYTTTDVYAAYCMVEAGLGVTMLNRIEAESWSGAVRLLPTDPPVELSIGIMYPDRSDMTLSAAGFLEALLGTA